MLAGLSEERPRLDPSSGLSTDGLAGLRGLFPAFCVLAAIVTFGFALYDSFQVDGDAIAYMDIADYLRTHQWAGAVNGYWHPMYPGFLAVGHTLARATLHDEVRACYLVNYGIFLLEMLAVIALCDGITNLRTTTGLRMHGAPDAYWTLDPEALRYVGIALLVFSSRHELRIGSIKPDGLLLVFLLLAIAALLRFLATARLFYAFAVGLALGCAYLTKSFALAFAVASLVVLLFCVVRRSDVSPLRIAAAALISCSTFCVIAGPYIAALSKKAGRLDVGDSGGLNYAWYVDRTDRMHLEPFMSDGFGAAHVRLDHPEEVLLRTPLVLSYSAIPYGSNPDWFDPAWWNAGVKPGFTIRAQISRLVKSGRRLAVFLIDHPEGWLLLLLLLALGSRTSLHLGRDANEFWIPSASPAAFAIAVYSLVNIEERYITFAYLCLILTFFASLRTKPGLQPRTLHTAAYLLTLVLAFVAVAYSFREMLEERRQVKADGLPGGWYSADLAHAAAALEAMGVHPGDTVACVGTSACLGEFYWARLAGVRILTEIYVPTTWPYQALRDMPNREEAIDMIRRQGRKVLVADFGTARVSTSDPFFRNWRQLADTSYYALPLNP